MAEERIERGGGLKAFIPEAAGQKTRVQEACEAVQRGLQRNPKKVFMLFCPAGNGPDEVWAGGWARAEEPKDPTGWEDAGPANPEDEGGVQPVDRQLRPEAGDDAQGERETVQAGHCHA